MCVEDCKFAFSLVHFSRSMYTFVHRFNLHSLKIMIVESLNVLTCSAMVLVQCHNCLTGFFTEKYAEHLRDTVVNKYKSFSKQCASPPREAKVVGHASGKTCLSEETTPTTTVRLQ